MSAAAKTTKPAPTPARRAMPAPRKTDKTGKPASAVKAMSAQAASQAPARKPALAKVAKAIKPTPASATAPVPAAKPPKLKLVRDSFTIPRSEYVVLDALKDRLVKLTRPAKKSEVLRAGIAMLATLHDAALLAALEAVPTIKTGRPKKAK
jgi:hypothetical protein